MTHALFSGLSGLRANQQYLDVIGNNLANSNTAGYKSSRVTFGDVLSQTLRPALAPTGSRGGINATQIGRGAFVASVDQNFLQGGLLSTGRTLDLAVQGDGFFVASDGSRNFYTRVGAFGLDGAQTLVDQRSGLPIRSTSGGSIQLPLNGVVPPLASSILSLRGNLPAKVDGPTIEAWSSSTAYSEAYAAVATGSNTAGPFNLSGPGAASLTIAVNGGATKTVTFAATDAVSGSLSSITAAEIATVLNSAASGLSGVTASVNGGAVELTSTKTGAAARIAVSGAAATVLGFSSTAVVGTESAATSTTALNDLKNNTTDYVTGDVIRVRGAKPDGSTVNGSFTYGVDGTTLGDLITFSNNLYGPDATVTLDSAGVAHLDGVNPGESSLDLSFSDDNVTGGGATTFATTAFEVDVVGKDPDQESSSLTVFDSLGVSHTLTVVFERTLAGDWSLTATVPADEGSVTSSTLPSLSFDTSGEAPSGLTGDIDIAWSSGAAAQTIAVSFEDAGTGERLTQLANGASISATQDGYAPGSLAAISIGQDGVITGEYTNGQSQSLAQLQLALFTNPAGLERTSNGLYVASSNSGNPQLTSAASGNAGTIVAGSLEGSNVDVAEEFVRLIEAQRGFQANARIISTSNEVLADLTRLGQ